MRFAADFQSIGRDGVLPITFDDYLDSGTPGVIVGGLVELDDLEGNTARGFVASINDDVVDVLVDLSTWARTTREGYFGWAPADRGFSSGFGSKTFVA